MPSFTVNCYMQMADTWNSTGCDVPVDRSDFHVFRAKFDNHQAVRGRCDERRISYQVRGSRHFFGSNTNYEIIGGSGE